jgi:hypothetical protein
MNEHIEEMASAIAKFYVERPVSEAREVLEATFRKIKKMSHVHDYVALLREYADFLERAIDWTPDQFSKWAPNPKPFGQK